MTERPSPLVGTKRTPALGRDGPLLVGAPFWRGRGRKAFEARGARSGPPAPCQRRIRKSATQFLPAVSVPKSGGRVGAAGARGGGRRFLTGPGTVPAPPATPAKTSRPAARRGRWPEGDRPLGQPAARRWRPCRPRRRPRPAPVGPASATASEAVEKLPE
jgi:hypothetical protein